MKKQKKLQFLKQSFKALLCEECCYACSQELRKSEEFLCETCFQKWKEKALLRYEGGYYFAYFYRGEIRDCLHDYKFQGCYGLGKIFAKLIKEAFWECYQREKIDVVIPVPIHEERLLQRGFNQCEEILKYLKVPYLKMERKKKTEALFQHQEKEKREQIMKDAFSCTLDLEGKNVLLFDDIITTGTTMKEMKKAILKQGKPRSISVFSIAFAERVKRHIQHPQ